MKFLKYFLIFLSMELKHRKTILKNIFFGSKIDKALKNWKPKYANAEKQIIDGNSITIRKLYLSVSSICNVDCSFCIYGQVEQNKKFKKGTMSDEIFEKTLEFINNLKIEKISFSSTVGEPLIDPRLFDKIKKLKLLGFKKIYTFSNGVLLSNNHNYEKVLTSGLSDYELSTSSFDEKNWSLMYRSNKYKSMIDGFSKLLEEAHKAKSELAITINFRPNISPLAIFFQKDFQGLLLPYFTKKVNFDYLTYLIDWGGKIDKNELPSGIRISKNPTFQPSMCLRMTDLVVLQDGAIRLCGCNINETEHDDLVIGHIFDEDINTIFYSEKAKKLRLSFYNNSIPSVCNKCSFYEPMILNKKFKL